MALPKQDRQGARTAQDLEQKYNWGKTFAEVFRLIKKSEKKVEKLDESLTAEELFNRLTENGKVQGIYRGQDGNIYLNASYMVTGELLAALIKAGMIQSKDGGFVINLDNGTIETDNITITGGNIEMEFEGRELADVMQCVSTRDSGRYMSLDWEEAPPVAYHRDSFTGEGTLRKTTIGHFLPEVLYGLFPNKRFKCINIYYKLYIVAPGAGDAVGDGTSTWDDEYDPSKNWTEEEKAENIGDLFYYDYSGAGIKAAWLYYWDGSGWRQKPYSEDGGFTEYGELAMDVHELAEIRAIASPDGESLVLAAGETLTMEIGDRAVFPQGSTVNLSEGGRIVFPKGGRVAIHDNEANSVTVSPLEDGEAVYYSEGKIISLPDGGFVSFPTGGSVTSEIGGKVIFTDNPIYTLGGSWRMFLRSPKTPYTVGDMWLPDSWDRDQHIWLEAGDYLASMNAAGIRFEGLSTSGSGAVSWAAHTWAGFTAKDGSAQYTVSASGGASSSDRVLKEDIRDMDGRYLDFIMALKPCLFKYLGAEAENVGFIAQDVEQAMESLGLSFHGYRGPTAQNKYRSLDYAAFAAPIVYALQNALKRVEELEEKVAALEK